MLLVLVEQDDGAVTAASLEALTLARTLASELDVALHAAAFGAQGELAPILSKHGVSTLHLIQGRVPVEYSPDLWGAGLAELTVATGASGVVAAASDRGDELLAQASARTGNAFAANCVAVETGEAWTLTRLRGGGILLEDAELSGAVKFVTVAAGALEQTEADVARECGVESFAVELDPQTPACSLVDRTTRGSGVSLATAGVIVSGGRGVGSAEGFAELEELAELLGGAVGCSRVATNAGWRPHSDQVGLTGTKIAADLYIACGISGATQHWVGCMGAKTILAINTDPDAALVGRSDYAVLGDLHEVLPAVIDRIRARKEVPGAA